MEILVSCRTGKTDGRATEVSVVPCKVSVKSVLRNVSSLVAEQLACEPPAPCREVVLHTYVIPRVVVLTLTLEVEVLTVTEVEVCDERLLREVPAEG